MSQKSAGLDITTEAPGPVLRGLGAAWLASCLAREGAHAQLALTVADLRRQPGAGRSRAKLANQD